MTNPNGNMPTESTPLLLPPDSEVSSETLVDPGTYEQENDKASQAVGKSRAILIILSLWVLIFLQTSNVSALTTTQSVIAADLDSFTKANWFTSAYLIATASVAPLAGRLSQIFSPRSCIFAASIFFGTGGFVTSQAKSFEVFILGRVISGIGAAGILTLSIILVLELTTKRRRGVFIGLVNLGYTSGVALGGVIAGGLLPLTGWRVLFLVQTPLALSAGVFLFFSIPKSFVTSPNSGKESLRYKLARVDYLGAITLTSTIVLFLYGMASTTIQWTPIAISGVLLPIFVFMELFVAQVPVIPISVLKSRGALLTCFAQLGFMCARWMVLFYTPVYAIAVRGWSPVEAGTILFPTNFGFGLGGLLIGALHIKRGGSFYIPCVISLTLFSISFFVLALISVPETPAMWYIVAAFWNGLCTGATLNYTLAHILHLTLPSTHFISTSLLATFRGFAGSFGSAIGGGLFLRVLQSTLIDGFKERGIEGEDELIRKLLGSPALVGTLNGAEKEVAIAGYVAALTTLFTYAGFLAVITIAVQAGAGWKSPLEKEVEQTLADEEVIR